MIMVYITSKYRIQDKHCHVLSLVH